MSLEQDLRGALRRKEPAAGFDDRVLSKIASAGTTRIPDRTSPRMTGLSWGVAASVILAAGSAYYMHNQQRLRDEHAARAARDVVLALQIASETISAAQAKVEEITHYGRENNH
jgi:hypothetical protein